jgi:hypothetical protein
MSFLHLILLAFAVVSLIALSPAIIDASGSFVAAIRAQQLTKLVPQWTDEPQTPVEVVNTLEDTRNDGFEVLSDDRVWDLRRLHKPAPGGSQVLGPSLLLRVSGLIRHTQDATQYKYRYQTAGSEFVAWSLDPGVKVRLLRSRQTTRSGGNELNTYELQFDVSGLEINKKFVLRAQAKILNAPWDRNNSWVGMRITDEVREASMRVIFPNSLPYQRPVFQKYPNDSPLEAQTFDGIVFNLAQEKELLWRVDRPQNGWTYRAQWDWQ